MSPYKKSDFRHVSWADYTRTVNNIAAAIDHYLNEHDIKLDAIIPILRASGIATQIIGYRLRQLTILPVQYKYLHRRGKIRLTKLNDTSLSLIKKSAPVLLVIENNHCFGTTSCAVMKDLRKRFPKARILYAAMYADYSCRKTPDAETAFYGHLTNETRTLTLAAAKKLGLDNSVSLFPWENEAEEWAAITGQTFDYKS